MEMKVADRPLAIVVSRNNLSGLGAIRALGIAGYTVDLIASVYRKGDSEVSGSSKYIRNHTEVVSLKSRDGADDELLAAMMKYPSDSGMKPVLLPTDEYTAFVVNTNRKILDEHFLIPVILSGDGSFGIFMENYAQTELAKEAGLLTPKGKKIFLQNGKYAFDDISYPCFCSADISVTSYKNDYAVCNSRDELRRHLNKMRFKDANRYALVQEYLEINHKIIFTGVCIDQKVTVPAAIKSYSGDNVLEAVPLESLGDIWTKVEVMMQRLNYVGPFSVVLNVVGDRVYFDYIDFGAGALNCLYAQYEISLPDMLISETIGANYEGLNMAEGLYGKKIACEDSLWKGCVSESISIKELRRYIESADLTVVTDKNDPAPGKILERNNKKIYLKRHLRYFIRGTVFPALRTFKRHIQRYPQIRKKNSRNNSEKPRILVSGRNYGSNLCMAKSLGRAGYDVEILRVFHRKPKFRNLLKKLRPEAYSKYVKAYYTCVYGGQSKRIVNRLMDIADTERKMLIIPVDDLVAAVIDDYYTELSEFYILPNIKNKSGEINRMMGKMVQKELAEKAGVPVVNSCVIRTVKGDFDIPDSVTYPCFIKPNISKNGSKKKMQRCDTRQELHDALKELSEIKDVEMLVEDYVNIKKEYSIVGVSTKNGVIGPGFFAAKDGGQSEHRGVAITGEVLPTTMMQQLIDNIVDFVATLKFDGLYDVDLIETDEGKMYFIEINMRFGGSGYAFTESGLNLPGIFADYMLFNKPLDKESRIDNWGKSFVSEKVLLEEYIKSRVSWQDYRHIMDNTDIHFIKDRDDMGPYRHFKRIYPVAMLMRIVNKVREIKDSEFGK